MARTVVTDKLLQDNLEFQGTESIRVPAGTTAQRGTPSGAGELRYNTELGALEVYSGSVWGEIGGGDVFTGDSGSGGIEGLVPAPAAGDAAASKFLKADGNWTIVDTSAGQLIGTPTDATFNDGAYYQASTVFQSGSVISGISTGGTVADALDGVNETIKNIHSNTYVQGAYFTRSPIEGGASPGTPLVVRFTIWRSLL